MTDSAAPTKNPYFIGTKVERLGRWSQCGEICDADTNRVRIQWLKKDGSPDRRTWVARTGLGSRWKVTATADVALTEREEFVLNQLSWGPRRQQAFDGAGRLAPEFEALKERGLIRLVSGDRWALTRERGVAVAQAMLDRDGIDRQAKAFDAY